MKKLKIISLPVVFMTILFICLMLVNLIPLSLMQDNMKESIKHYNENRQKSYFCDTRLAKNDSSADSTALNVMYNTSKDRLLYSTLITPAYRDFSSQDFTTMSYDTIINGKEANYDYNRYWHGYQVLWKPLMILFNANTIRVLMLGLYIILSSFVLYSCYKMGYKTLGVGLGVTNLVYIVPFGFTALEYIPVFFIMMIASLMLIKTKIEPLVIMTCSGIAVAFFDFLTSETLTLTVPLLVYLYLKKEKPKFLEFVKLGTSWLVGYCGAFVTKWGLSSLIYQKNYFKIAFEKYDTHKSLFGPMVSLKSNISVLFGDKLSFNDAFTVFVILTSMIIIFVYLFRKETVSNKYLLFILVICLIPYVRYLIISGHSWGFAWFTYRAQLVIFLGLVLALSEVNLSMIFKRKEKK